MELLEGWNKFDHEENLWKELMKTLGPIQQMLPLSSLPYSRNAAYCSHKLDITMESRGSYLNWWQAKKDQLLFLKDIALNLSCFLVKILNWIFQMNLKWKTLTVAKCMICFSSVLPYTLNNGIKECTHKYWWC